MAAPYKLHGGNSTTRSLHAWNECTKREYAKDVRQAAARDAQHGRRAVASLRRHGARTGVRTLHATLSVLGFGRFGRGGLRACAIRRRGEFGRRGHLGEGEGEDREPHAKELDALGPGRAALLLDEGAGRDPTDGREVKVRDRQRVKGDELREACAAQNAVLNIRGAGGSGGQSGVWQCEFALAVLTRTVSPSSVGGSFFLNTAQDRGSGWTGRR